MIPRDPLTRYWFIGELARTGALAAIDQDGRITRPLRPHGPPVVDPEPTVHVYRGPPVALRPHSYQALRDAFVQGDNTHVDPRDARTARRHMLGYWDSKS